MTAEEFEKSNELWGGCGRYGFAEAYAKHENEALKAELSNSVDYHVKKNEQIEALQKQVEELEESSNYLHKLLNHLRAIGRWKKEELQGFEQALKE